MKRLIVAAVLMFSIAQSVQAQNTFHVFPQIVNGVSGSAFYIGALTIFPAFASDSTTITCSMRFYGSTINTGLFGDVNNFTFTLQGNQWGYILTRPTVPLQVAYGTLTCSTFVYAFLEYSLYYVSGNGAVKLGGAAVFSSEESFRAKYIHDGSEDSSQLGIAIANNTDIPRNYTITVRDSVGAVVGTSKFQVAARRSRAQFLDEMVTGTNGRLVHALIESDDFTSFTSIGFHFVGAVFSTVIPAN